jgi:hypothetical protein
MKKNGGTPPLLWDGTIWKSIPVLFFKEKVKWNVVGEMRQFKKGGLHVFTLCICLLICDMHWCGFADLSHYEKRVLVSCQLAPLALLLLTPRYRTGWHIHKKGFIFSFFMSTCTSCPKNQWDFQDYNVRRFISYFFPPQKVLVARQWKLPTWLIFTRRQSRNPEPWYARSPFSLYHYHVSISYYIPPNPLWDFIAGGDGGRGRKRS